MIRIDLYKSWSEKMNEDKQKDQKDISTAHINLDGICAMGMTDPLLARPLWQGHRYAKLDNWHELYCPTHKIIYDRIQKMNNLNEKQM